MKVVLVLLAIYVGLASSLLDYNITNLPRCNLTTVQLSNIGREDVEPCVIYHVDPVFNSPNVSVIKLVQITPTGCSDHRDGALIGVEALNQDNDGRGFRIGYQKNHFIKFSLISIIAGNSKYLGSAKYSQLHQQLLNDTLSEFDIHFVVGTCSGESSAEQIPPMVHKKILLAQVGPPAYYASNKEYIFGMHLNSNTYSYPAIRTLSFHLDATQQNRSSVPVRVIYRTKSEFFNRTCVSAINYAKSLGFHVEAWPFDPDGDHDENGISNLEDLDFLRRLADASCPPEPVMVQYSPALFLCVNAELSVLIERWRENGCRPPLVWATASTWAWAIQNKPKVPFLQGGGQWHQAFGYSDKYFDSGAALLEYHGSRFGYTASYDMVGVYSSTMLFCQLLEVHYRLDDTPTVAADLADPGEYEQIRRDFQLIDGDTLFGPVAFNSHQRNIGRGTAGTQWQEANTNTDGKFVNKCISPIEQAEAATIVPSKASLDCEPGTLVSLTMVQNDSCILCDKCDSCPVDTFSNTPNAALECKPCPEGTSTDGLEGASECREENLHLLPLGIRIMGYGFVALVWFLAIRFSTWLYNYRDDPVVKFSQPEFLLLIIIGAVISSSTIIALGSEAGFDDADISRASFGCSSLPWTYCIGWVLQYASLGAKSYRLHRLTNSSSFRRIKLTALSTSKFIGAALLLDVAIIAFWTYLDPLVYERKITGTRVDEESGIITIDSIGQCTNGSYADFFTFVGPLGLFHVGLILVSNFYLWKNRSLTDRYQEGKYVLLASLYVCEILLVGAPVLFAVRDSAVSRYIVLSSIVFLNDSGVLCFVFMPKIWFVEKGLPEGMSVLQTIRKDDFYSGMAMAHLQNRHSLTGNQNGGESTITTLQNNFERSNAGKEEDKSTPLSDIDETDRSHFVDVLSNRYCEVSMGSAQSNLTKG